MPAPTKILIISNCQVQPLKHGLSSVCENIEIDTIPVHVIPLEKREEVFTKYISKKNEYAFVLSIPLSEDFGLLQSQQIISNFHPTPVFSISNLTFTGLHPDITYIGGLSKRAPGPIGDYHSQMALLAFLMDLPASEAGKLYCDTIYRHVGFYDHYASSLEEMRRRDADTTIPIGELLEMRLRQGICFLSHNHPTSFLLAPYIVKIADWLAERGLVKHPRLDLQPEEMINFLACSSIFPIYPELVSHHNLPYQGSYVFRTQTVGDEPMKALTLSTFIKGEYDAFRHADRDFLAQSYPGNWLTAIYGKVESFQQLVAALPPYSA